MKCPIPTFGSTLTWPTGDVHLVPLVLNLIDHPSFRPFKGSCGLERDKDHLGTLTY